VKQEEESSKLNKKRKFEDTMQQGSDSLRSEEINTIDNALEVMAAKVKELEKQKRAAYSNLEKELEAKIEVVNQLSKEKEILQEDNHELKNEVQKYKRICGENVEGLSLEQLQQLVKQQEEVVAKIKEALSKVVSNKLDEIKGERMCSLCCEQEKNVMLNPCGHVKICDKCAEKELKRCPYCGKDIESFQKVYL